MPTDAKRSFWGRVVVLGFFWGLTAYAAVAVVASVVLSLFGHPPMHSGDALGRARERAWCLRTLAGLRDELESEVTSELTYRELQSAHGRFGAFEERWQGDFEQAASRCDASVEPEMADAYARLRDLNHGYAEALGKLVRTREESGAALSESLRELTGPAPVK